MAKFKVGDKVLVRNDLIVGELYGKMYFVERMCSIRGKVVTITEVRPSSYTIKEHDAPYWTDEMFEGLVEETPREFKVGDRVRCVLAEWGDLKVGDLGTIVTMESGIGVEFDTPNGGHECGGNGKDGYCWWMGEDEIELVKEEPKEEPIPTPVINVNVTVNLYENACWYCRKGGLVDLYLAGTMGICPSCGRVCNNTLPTKPKKESIIIEFKPKRENKPLTKEELKALPDGTRVFTVWHDRYISKGGKPNWNDPKTTWRTKKENRLEWSNGFSSVENMGNFYLAYLEEPERPF